jgi:hypothetical protein
MLRSTTPNHFDGTIGGLVRCYRTLPSSPYQAVKSSTRTRDYDPALKLIEDTVGKRAVHALTASDFDRWYKNWAEDSKVRRAHGAIRKLRQAFSFGVVERYPHCKQAREILALMRFAAPKARSVKMTYDQAKALVEAAIAAGRPSVAMTQAIQWDTSLRRVNVIGEWLPLKPGEERSGIVRGNSRWSGPTVQDLSPDLIFTLEATAKGGAGTRFDFKECDLVMLALEHYQLPAVGPLILSEDTGRPWRENYYAHAWREIADSISLPKGLWSMDSRAGAISETEEVAGIEAARKTATHTNAKTTARYVRNDLLEHNREVARKRRKNRI